MRAKRRSVKRRSVRRSVKRRSVHRSVKRRSVRRFRYDERPQPQPQPQQPPVLDDRYALDDARVALWRQITARPDVRAAIDNRDRAFNAWLNSLGEEHERRQQEYDEADGALTRQLHLAGWPLAQ